MRLVCVAGDLATGRLIRGATEGAAAFTYAEIVLDSGERRTLLVVDAHGRLAALNVAVDHDRAVCVRSAEVAR